MPSSIPQPDLITPPANNSSSGDLVGERFTQAENFVDTYESLAFSYINQLANKYYEIFWTGPSYAREDLMGLDTLQMPDPGLLTVDPISVADVDFDGSRPDPASVVVTSDPPPEFSAADPNVRDVPVPDETFPVFSENPPDITDPDIPTAPTITLPPVPALDAISIPGPPDYNLATGTHIQLRRGGLHLGRERCYKGQADLQYPARGNRPKRCY
jgi:hypothetical protein